MIKFENTEVIGWETAIRGMRNPMNSWKKGDSGWKWFSHEDAVKIYNDENVEVLDESDRSEDGLCLNIIGPNDLGLMKRLVKAGTDHRKFMRMITVYVDITAPLYWWKEFDTYKVGTVANSCSTMHKIHEKEFTIEDFSCEYLMDLYEQTAYYQSNVKYTYNYKNVMNEIIEVLNNARELFLKTKDKNYWYTMIQLLPSSYNQKRTVMLNYEVLANIYKSRKNHKLDEWSEHSKDEIIENALNGKLGFCDWIKTLPYSRSIIGESLSD